MLDRIIEEFNEILINAEVDYPAGHEAGHRISYDDEKLTLALQKILPPTNFIWINKPVTVIGEDFSYEATCLCAFPKTNGKVRYIVEDRGRLFIQREEQINFHTQPPSQERVAVEITERIGAVEVRQRIYESTTFDEVIELSYQRNTIDPLGR